jgi:hypothetical protein
MDFLYIFFALVLASLVFGVRWLRRAQRSRRFLVLAGFIYWWALWTAFYLVQEAAVPRANLGEAIFVLLAAAVIHLLIIVVLPIARLPWPALGYLTAMLLNLAGQFTVYNVLMDAREVVVGGITYYTPYIRDLSSLGLYLLGSRPFFLPVTFGV